MHPELAVAVGRNFESRHSHALDTGFVGFDKNGVGLGDDAQHLERQRRHQVALRLHDHRNAADDAVAFGADREQSAPRRRLLENGNVPEQSRKTQQKRPRIAAQCGEPGQRQLQFRLRDEFRQTGFTENRRRLTQDVGEHLIVARQCPQFRAAFFIEIAE